MDELKDYLLSRFNDARLASGGKEVTMRCRFCGDSRTDAYARHLYIKVDGEVPLYNCFKCGAKGVVTSDTIKILNPQFDSTDTYIMKYLNANKKAISKFMLMNPKDGMYRFRNTFISNIRLSNLKLKYINSRLGLNLTFNDLIDNKIVLNLWDILRENHIDSFSRPIQQINSLNNYGIGFLSMNNSVVTLRNIGNGGSRYATYSMLPNIKTSQEYIIPADIELNKPVNVHIAEGVFDILSVKYNLCNGERNQNMYIAMCGKKYYGTVALVLKKFGLVNPTFHIYPDNDVGMKTLSKPIRVLKNFRYTTYIHRNGFKGEKDMGVDKNHILDRVMKVV